MRTRFGLILAAGLLGASAVGAVPATAGQASTTVIDWNQYAVEAIFNLPTAAVPGAGQSPTVGGIHLAMVQIAVYDALNAIVGDYEPYLNDLPSAPSTASKDAAIATAAHDVLVGLGTVGNAPSIPAAVVTRLDGYLAATLAAVPDGAAENAGVAIGAAAADAILADRADDNRGGSFRFTVGTLPGEWRPTAANGLNDPFAWVKDVRPFTLRSGDQYMSEGPPALSSELYAIEFDEVKSVGSVGSTTRTDAQTATGLYFTENTYTLFNRSYRALASPAGRDLSAMKTARLLALANVASADAIIDCWNNKARWSNWRPVTAIALAADDGNPATTAEAGWTPLIPTGTPPYPDVTSGYNCSTAAFMLTSRVFFGTDHVDFTLINANGVTRDYHRFSDVFRDTIEARIWLGIHFRSADTQGAWVGKKVGQWVGNRYFQPLD